MTEGHTRRLQAILAADVVGYSRLMNRDEEGTLGRLQALEREAVDPAIAEHGGEIVKRLGDGVLAVFPSAVAALRAARAIRERAALNQADHEAPIVYRIGLNVGDVIEAGNDIFGDGVNIASRLEGLADPAGIVLSAAVHDNVRAQDPGPFDDLGEREVKNIEHPVRAYRVRFEDSPPLAASAGRGAQPWLIGAGLALALVAGLLAWALWPEPVPEAVDPASAPAPAATEPQPAKATPQEVVAPRPAVANSRAAYPDPDTGRPTAPDVAPAQAEPEQPNFGERLVESIADAIEDELANGDGSTGGPPSRGKVPPGQAKKAQRK